jgi:folate-binding protein YgfZ
VAIADSLVHDYEVLTSGAGLVDRSERGKLAIVGPDAAEVLQGQVTQDVVALEPNQGAYAALLTHKGKMLGDLRVLRTEDALLIDCERVALQELFNALRRGLVGFDGELVKRTLQEAQLSLVGPRSRAVAGVDPGPQEHAHLEADGVRWVTTDLGLDAFVAAEGAEPLTRRLLDAGAQPVSEEAAEVVRVESGRPRFGLDLEPAAVIPQEAALNERAVSFTKGCYTGQETVARLFYKGKPNRHLRGLRLSAAAPSGSVVRGESERELGRLGTSVLSPRLGPIALAVVRREAQVGDRIVVGDGGVTGEIVDLPFAGGGEEAA